MKEITIEAITDNLDDVIAFVSGELENFGCSVKLQMQIELSVEEIFVNIAHYAYTQEVGMATICVDIDSENMMSLTFTDRGVPYDPLKKPDPDITLSAEDRQIGGLGIFMVKKYMDDVIYEYKDGQNVLTLKKKIV
ncbi:MAG: ATP-binding protein [Clostridia bacterium]|nr:ATP-binding protein [Clostridia bacterium]MBQ2670884.1 ATP-binding protein [Clostridia bacterium]MBQ3462331.1 ATP-binding protein [Clostridia bacterium]MBQ3472375.1 ATP-binding protein [Clostridia bacterium]MBQ6530174.1 ATP-binding protein [Clostridia bacterium]